MEVAKWLNHPVLFTLNHLTVDTFKEIENKAANGRGQGLRQNESLVPNSDVFRLLLLLGQHVHHEGKVYRLKGAKPDACNMHSNLRIRVK